MRAVGGSAFNPLAEVADVHSGDHYLFASCSGYLACLGNHLAYCAGSAAAACGRYGAVSAPIVASVLHLEEIAGTVSA